jgi:hypothetical protein
VLTQNTPRVDRGFISHCRLDTSSCSNNEVVVESFAWHRANIPEARVRAVGAPQNLNPVKNGRYQSDSANPSFSVTTENHAEQPRQLDDLEGSPLASGAS